MNRLSSRGFSLVELAITVTVLGLIMAFSIPAFQGYTLTHQLKGATENMASQVRLMREVSIGTGTNQTMHFFYATFGGDYHIHNLGVVGGTWSLPRNITYNWAAGTSSVMMSTPDGRIANSGMIILQDNRGNMDTVSVLASGLVLTK